MFETFEDLDNIQSTEEVIPFQFREEKSEEGTLEWLNKDFRECTKDHFNDLLCIVDIFKCTRTYLKSMGMD